MAPEHGNPARAGDAAGLVIAFPGGNCSPGHNSNLLNPQARRRLEVRIAACGRSWAFRLLERDFNELIAAADRLKVRPSVRDGRAPHGRSRAFFKIKKADLAELIACAERLEAPP
jgi:hypothetical protein